MKGVLVDTSVWVDHFRQRNQMLIGLLERDLVLIHLMILGAIACGAPPARAQMLSELGRLEQAQHANLREVLYFIERDELYGQGCGLVDLTLLASSLMSPNTALWTIDKRLGALAKRCGVAYRPSVH